MKIFVLSMLAVTAVGFAGAPSASATATWWGLTSGTRPAKLQSGLAKNEVQEITTSPKLVFQLLVEGNSIGPFATEPYYSMFGGAFPEATAANLQKALESVYGAGNVVVTGGPAEAAPFIVTSVNQAAYKAVPKIEIGVTLGGTAEAKVVTEGRADGVVVVTAENLGNAIADGGPDPVKIADRLPPGMTAVGIDGVAGENPKTTSKNRGPVNCSLESLECTFEGQLPSYEEIEVRISVVVGAGARSLEENQVTVSGGGATTPKTLTRTIVTGGANEFGVEEYRLTAENADGSPDRQGGSHPFQLTSIVTLNQTFDKKGLPQSIGLAKDVAAELPAGLVGNPTVLPQCTDVQFDDETGDLPNACPPSSAVGVATVTFNEPSVAEFDTNVVPVFNMVPQVGEPARFGFKIFGRIPVFLDTSVRTGGDYGVTVTARNIIQVSSLLSAKITLWGVPGNSSHDRQRGWECIQGGTCAPPNVRERTPFLVMPTSCAHAAVTSVRGDSWGNASLELPLLASYTFPARLVGCNSLNFSPEIEVAPDGQEASSPTGVQVRVHVSQDAALNPDGTAESAVKDTTVTLPEGLTLDPSGADGLEACSEGQIGFRGFGSSGAALFTARLVSSPEPFCPAGSKVGTVEIQTPLLPHKLEGAVYLASPAPFGEPGLNPFGSLIAMYIVAEDPVSGTLVKLPGEVSPDPATGRLTSTFKNTPQLPFENLTVHFFGGSRAPLSTPPLCGAYETNATFTPWSGNPPSQSSSPFKITSGPNGGPCQSPLPFSPSLTGGSTNINAGAFTPFTMTMGREDGNQDLQSIGLKMPPGLSGLLTGVELCGEAEANAGTCGPGSLIGETIVSVGVGNAPFTVTGGKVYLTGPYKGAPFGLSIVNPAKAGPYDLGQVIVRAKIEVDPVTAGLTVTSDDEGQFKIPTIIDGIPLQIKHINVTIDRPGFTFNPTNCNSLKIDGTLHSTEGATASLAVPFQVTNCATLGFKPRFEAFTSGRTSRADGASLHVKLVYPKAPFGSQANVASVKVDLPRQLPSRLTTLQKACVDRVFDANPAACPAASKVGSALAITPLIPVPLEGPAYFVSHGGAKFPELIVALQGYGIAIMLHGETFINKAGITSSTFRTVPDQPVGSFELTLPEQSNSALAANGNLCASPLTMPTKFTGQNGAALEQKTKIAVTGCKPAIRVLGHRVKGSHATIRVSVPSAGTLVASGSYVKRSVKRAAKAGVLTIGVSLTGRGLGVLAKHPRERVNARVKVTFRRKQGAPLTTYVRLLMG